MQRLLCSVVTSIIVCAKSAAVAGPITLSDFAPGSTLLTFDEFEHGTVLSTEFAELGVILGSGEPLGPELTPNPADWLPPGGSVAPFVRVSIDVVADASCCDGSGDKAFVGFEDAQGISSVVLTPVP